uniref:EGF-like domain-containing protein n=1 Tax=Syphacia muris TaxID=451379 RepID=A0A0N5AWP0_9BILA
MVSRQYTYELHLTKDGGSSEEIRDGYVKENRPFRVICSADKGLTGLKFFHDNNNLITAGATTKDYRSEFNVKKFQREHCGSYTCTAQYGGQKVEKILMVHANHFLEDIGDAQPCVHNHCRNGGQCYMSPNGHFAPFCVCKAIFAGENCTLVAQYPASGRTDIESGIAASGALFFMLTTLLLAFMYGRQRRQLKMLSKAPVNNQIFNPIETAAKTGLMEAYTVVKASDKEYSKQKFNVLKNADINDNEPSKNIADLKPKKLKNDEFTPLMMPEEQLPNKRIENSVNKEANGKIIV